MTLKDKRVRGHPAWMPRSRELSMKTQGGAEAVRVVGWKVDKRKKKKNKRCGGDRLFYEVPSLRKITTIARYHL